MTEWNIVMLCLPPHTTHRMQPLDKTFFGPLKVNYNRECDKWMVTNAGRRISQYEQASLFSAAYLRSATMEKAVSGFKSTGLWPFNPDVFSAEDFRASLVTDEPPLDKVGLLPSDCDLGSSGLGSAVVSAPSLIPLNEGLPSDCDLSSSGLGSAVVSLIPLSKALPSDCDMGSSELGSAVVTAPSLIPLNEALPSHCDLSSSGLGSAVVSDSDVLRPNMLQDRNPSTGASSLMAEATAVTQELSPLPKSNTSRKITRHVEGAEVITGSPYKRRMLEKSEKESTTSKPQVKDKLPKKKLTCKLDKARGRKPVRPNGESNKAKSMQQREDEKQNRKPKTKRGKKNKSGGVGEDDTPCLYCGGLYSESAEGWIQCTGRCQLWAHNSCAGTDSQGDVGFVCELCG